MIWWACTLVPRAQYMEPFFLTNLNIPDLDQSQVHKFCEALRLCTFKGNHRAMRNAFKNCSYTSPTTAALLYTFVCYRDICRSCALVKYNQPVQCGSGEAKETLQERQERAIRTSRYLSDDEVIPPHLYKIYACSVCEYFLAVVLLCLLF